MPYQTRPAATTDSGQPANVDIVTVRVCGGRARLGKASPGTVDAQQRMRLCGVLEFS